MTKNEIIDAVLACMDPEGTTPNGVHIERFVALARRLPAFRDVVAAPVEPAPAPVEPVVETPAAE